MDICFAKKSIKKTYQNLLKSNNYHGCIVWVMLYVFSRNFYHFSQPIQIFPILAHSFEAWIANPSKTSEKHENRVTAKH